MIAIALLVFYSVFDSLRDKSSGRWGWPDNGWRLMYRRPFRWRLAKTKPDSADAEASGYRLFYTLDTSHTIKWLHLYPIAVYVLLDVPTLWGKLGTVIACLLAWKIIPKPKHWG